MKDLKLLIIVTSLVVLATACSSQNTQNLPNTLPEDIGSSTAVVPTHTATNPPPTNTPIPQEATSESDGFPPLTFEEILEAGIDAGDWSETEGLIQILRYFVGETSADQIPGITNVVANAGSGILHKAVDYLNNPDTSAESRAELELVLGFLIPPQELLDAIREQRSFTSSALLVAFKPQPVIQNTDVCTDISWMELSEEEIEALASCYFYREKVINNIRLRVYYPYNWEGQEAGDAIINGTFDALGNSANTYSSFQALTVPAVDLIFSLDDIESFSGAQIPADLVSQECLLIFSRSALTDHSIPEFAQLVAHEMFHCVQESSFPNTNPYEDHSWWLEGTADYFSNLVYPGVNLEWDNLDYFDSYSTYTSVFDMDYENFVFFQYLGNKYSPEVLIDILMRISAAGGRAAQEAELAAVQGMADNFNRFVVEYLSKGIRDSGGGMISKSPSSTTGLKTIDDQGEVEFTVQPFTAMRFYVDYKQEKRFLQTANNPDDTQFSGAEYRVHRNIESWSDLPPEIRSECEKDVRYFFVITTTKDSYTAYDVNVTLVEQAECDPCLLGTWDVDPVSYAQAMEDLMSQVDIGGMSLDLIISGHEYLQFVTEGKVFTQREDFAITVNGIITTTIDGFGSGNYSANGEELTVTNFLDTADSVGISFFGSNDPAQFTGSFLNEGDTPQSQTVPYICEQDTMILTLPQLGDLLFNRVDKILPTPIPTEGPPDNPQP